MFLKLVAFALVLQTSLGEELIPQEKSVVETYMVRSDQDNHLDVHSRKFVKVFDPKIGKYAFKSVTNDNGKIHREAGFLTDEQASFEKNPTNLPRENPSGLMNKVKQFMKEIVSRIALLN